MSVKHDSPIPVQLPEETLQAYHVIIQRLMRRLGAMRVILTDKDDPGAEETLTIEFLQSKGHLIVTRCPASTEKLQ